MAMEGREWVTRDEVDRVNWEPRRNSLVSAEGGSLHWVARAG